MSLTAKYTSKLTAIETLTDALIDGSDKTVTHSGLNVAETTYTGATGTPVSKVAAYEKAMSGGAGTIDLTAVLGSAGATVTGDGLKVQFVKLRARATNANDITIVQGASNSYPLFGSSFSITLKPGQEILASLNNAAGTIGSGAKTIDISGTGSQVLQVEFVMG